MEIPRENTLLLSRLMRAPDRVFARNLGKMSAEPLPVKTMVRCVVKYSLSWACSLFEFLESWLLSCAEAIEQ